MVDTQWHIDIHIALCVVKYKGVCCTKVECKKVQSTW